MGEACTGARRGSQEKHRKLRLVAEITGVSYDSPMLDWSQCSVVERDPQKVSGAWVFKGTRVPVKALFENLEDGARVDDFLNWFPGVAREQIEAVPKTPRTK